MRSIFSKTRTKFSKTRTKFSKTGLNSVKQRSELSRTRSNGRVNLKYCINQPGTLYSGCVLLPLGSPTRVPNDHMCMRGGHHHERASRCRAGGSQGGYTGYGIWVGTGRVIPLHPARCSRREGPASAAGPGSPAGAGVGGQGLDGRTGDGGGVGPGYHPSGPVGLPWSPPCTQDLANAASQPIRARLRLIS